MVMVDVERPLPSGRPGADRADSTLLAERFLIAREADPIERFEIGIPYIACFGSWRHISQPIASRGFGGSAL
jgi:hypothetical protein